MLSTGQGGELLGERNYMERCGEVEFHVNKYGIPIKQFFMILYS